jgi:hypothetical protein
MMESSPANCVDCWFHRTDPLVDTWCKAKPGLELPSERTGFPIGCPLPVTVKKLTKAEQEFLAELINDG